MPARELRMLANDILAQLNSKGLNGKQSISVVSEMIALITNELTGESENSSGSV
jgi:hypothetical protein